MQTIKLVELDITQITQHEEFSDPTISFASIITAYLSLVKFCHWYTKNYNEHIVIGELYSQLDSLFDKFQEEIIITTKTQQKPFPIFNFQFDMQNQKSVENVKTLFIEKTNEFLGVLTSLELKGFIESNNSGLGNTKEEIISSINKSLYLLSMIN
jgi:hypothetical protein